MTRRLRGGRRLGWAAALAWGMLAAPPLAWAAIVQFANGDQLTGRIVEEHAAALVLDHTGLGRLTIERALVARVVRDAPPPVHVEGAPTWTRELAAGYNLRRGNTDNEDLSGSLHLNRKTDDDEWTAQAEGAYASSEREMITQRYDGSLRYAFSFGSRLAWYNFYKVRGSHDRFANVDWRAVLSTGVGYWFADRPAWKAMAELGIGWEQTNFRSGTPSRSDPVLVPRVFVQKTLWGDATFSQDLVIWPNVAEPSEYRFRATTLLDQPLTANTALRLSFVDEYQSDPGGTATRNDARLTSSLVYSF